MCNFDESGIIRTVTGIQVRYDTTGLSPNRPRTELQVTRGRQRGDNLAGLRPHLSLHKRSPPGNTQWGLGRTSGAVEEDEYCQPW